MVSICLIDNVTFRPIEESRLTNFVTCIEKSRRLESFCVDKFCAFVLFLCCRYVGKTRDYFRLETGKLVILLTAEMDYLLQRYINFKKNLSTAVLSNPFLETNKETKKMIHDNWS